MQWLQTGREKSCIGGPRTQRTVVIERKENNEKKKKKIYGTEYNDCVFNIPLRIWKLLVSNIYPDIQVFRGFPK
jgi:hypothetical protein